LPALRTTIVKLTCPPAVTVGVVVSLSMVMRGAGF
jgi:hypothetical protein